MSTVCNGVGTVNICDYDDDVANFCHWSDDNEFNDLLDCNLCSSDIADISCPLPSIQNDLAKIDADNSHCISLDDEFNDLDIKPEIRNVNCMWSVFASTYMAANASNVNNYNNADNNNSAASSYSESAAVPPAEATGTSLIKREPIDEQEQQPQLPQQKQQQQQQQQQKQQNCTDSSSNIDKKIRISCIPAGKATSATISIPTRVLQRDAVNSNCKIYNEPYIPPGGSLLRKSNTAQHKLQQQQQQQYKLQLEQQRLINYSISLNNNANTNTIILPEDDILPDFRHNVDLAACIMGSNNISLTSSTDANYIDHLSRELQNTSKERIDLPYRLEHKFSDVLEVLDRQTQPRTTIAATAATVASAASTTTTTTTTPTHIVDLSAAVAGFSPPATTASSSECDSDDGECSVVNSRCGSSTSLDCNNGLYMRHISDHSYTRCNEMETTLETPSDSDEEIDVVSLNDKKLPTNPSDRDRRALQTKVAHKISNGARVPLKPHMFDLPYTPASSSPVKSVVNSRYPSPSSTPRQGAGAVPAAYSPESMSQSSSSSSGSDCTTTPASMADGKCRKRYYMNDCTSSSSSSNRVYSIKYNMNAAKRSRMRKVNADSHCGSYYKDLVELDVKPSNSSSINISSSSSSSSSSNSNSNSSNSNSNMLNRQLSSDDADTIEKRNLHNDMERQRRIGLKNLFESLKKQIPTIRDKERAPKVNILREAAKLCEQLTSEEQSLSLKRQQLKAELKQSQEMIARLRRNMKLAASS